MKHTAEFEKIPRARLLRGLAAVLLQGFTRHPDALYTLVTNGEDQFVATAIATDEYGFTRSEYRKIYKRLARAAAQMGQSVIVQ